MKLISRQRFRIEGCGLLENWGTGFKKSRAGIEESKRACILLTQLMGML